MFPMGTGEVMEGRVFSTFFALLFMSWLVAWVSWLVAWVILILFCINGTESYESKCTHEIPVLSKGIGAKARSTQGASFEGLLSFVEPPLVQ
jgi:hypothetical protein